MTANEHIVPLLRRAFLITMMSISCSLHASTPKPVSFAEGSRVALSPAGINPVANSGTFTSAPVDLRNNGRPDLVVGLGVFPPTPKTDVPLRILRGSASGTLLDVTQQLMGGRPIPARVHPREIATADLNRDGRPDLFIAAHGYDTSPFPGERNVLLLSRPDGTFDDRSSLLTQNADFSHSTTIADINGDGIPDIYVGQVYGGAQVSPYFLVGKADGTWAQRTDNLPSAMLTLGRKFVASLLLDVNGDGAPDLILGTDHDGGNADNIILLNDGTGDFTKRTEIKLPPSVFGANQNVMDIVPLDINGDGKLDLLVCGTQADPFYAGRFLQVLISQGDGTFKDETNARLSGRASSFSGAWNRFIRVVDLNGDGAPDLVLQADQGYSGENIDLIWLNDGAGHFTGVSNTVLAEKLGNVDVIDIDEDGRPDLVELSTTGAPGILQYRPFFNTTPRKALAKRGGIDLDGNNRAALLLRNGSNELRAGRLVNDQFQWSVLQNPSSDYRLLGAGNLSGDNKSDLLMLNLAEGDSGAAKVWRDFLASNERTLRNVRVLWRVDALGDLDGDGFGDIVWRFTGNSGNIDDTGVSYIWFTDGSVINQSTGTAVGQVRKRGGAPLDWTLLGAADLNADGADDMVYISPTNAVRVLMATPARTCANLAGGTLPTGHKAVRLGDFSSNKRAEILLHETATGTIKLWMLDATGIVLPTYAGQPDDPNAACTPGGSLRLNTELKTLGSVALTSEFLGAGDFDGDGITDIAWKKNDGTIAIWKMGTGGRVASTVEAAGTVPASYSGFALQ